MDTILTAAQHAYIRLGWLKSAPVRWALALAYTLFLTLLLIQSSGHPYVGQPAPPGPPDFRREVFLTTGHIIGFSVLTWLWWWTLLPKLPSHRALFASVGFALIFGAMTEFAQIAVPDRSASWFDLLTNWVVTFAAAQVIQRVVVPWQIRHPNPGIMK